MGSGQKPVAFSDPSFPRKVWLRGNHPYRPGRRTGFLPFGLHHLLLHEDWKGGEHPVPGAQGHWDGSRWASARGRDLDAEIRHGAFISTADAEAIADHVTLDVEAQVRANELASQVSQRPKKVGGLEPFRPHPTKQGVQGQSASPVEVAARIGYVAEYVEWLLDHRLGFSDGGRVEVQALREKGKQVVARLRQRRRGSGSPTNPDEALEGVSQDVVELVSAALLPDAPENPFQPGFIRARNQLMWHLYISTGGRREEVLSVLVKDIIFSSRRLTVSKSETKVRTVSISGDAAQLFVRFIDEHWAGLPQVARRRISCSPGPTERRSAVVQ